ncbi:MAG TPA: response regulator transcription factor [Tenuifilaceae bacterium]|nr:response regulator transcription factor [Tenuifilaceae bacterium]
MINVLIVDDHPLIAQGLVKSLEKLDSIKVCGIAITGKEALEKVEFLNPDVVLLDIRLPDDNGINICKSITKKTPSQKVIALTTFNQRYYIQSMIDAGVQGYLLKSSSADEIIEAIICVSEGETYYCEEVEKILRQQNEQSIYISKREMEVLKLIAEGFTNQEIAEKLFISPLTVDSHRKNLIMKLGAKNTASLISIANSDGYL